MVAKKHKKSLAGNNTISKNRRAGYHYFLEGRLEAGIVLQGWEVKSIRCGRVQINESYIVINKGEAWLYGAHISPLLSASTHIHPDSVRGRKLLLHRAEINKLIGAVDRKGYTIVLVTMYWKKGRVKLEIALAKGKRTPDKRAAKKESDWALQKARLLKRQ